MSQIVNQKLLLFLHKTMGTLFTTSFVIQLENTLSRFARDQVSVLGGRSGTHLGIKMHHGWSPHDGMRAPSRGTKIFWMAGTIFDGGTASSWGIDPPPPVGQP